MTTEETQPGSEDPCDKDERVAIEVGRGVEWLCEPEMVGWRTTAGGCDGPLDLPVLPL